MGGNRSAQELFLRWFFFPIAISIFMAGPVFALVPRLSVAGDEYAAPWFRIENLQMALDFSPEPHHSPENAVLKGFSLPVQSETAAPQPFWIDEINGASLPTLNASSEVVLNQAAGVMEAYIDLTTVEGAPVTFGRSVRLVEDGSSLEVNYSFRNRDIVPRRVQYAIRVPWLTDPSAPDFRYHMPLVTGIERGDSSSIREPRRIGSKDFQAPWVGFDFVGCDLGFLMVSDRFAGDVVLSPKGTDGGMVYPLMEAVLRPGEIFKGAYWMSFAHGIGTPIAVSPTYASGAVWVPGPAAGTYRLETRLFAMPRPMKRIRVFSALKQSGGFAGFAPEYTQRSLLPAATPLKVLHDPVVREGFYELEQSIYSGSEVRGYWKVALATPGIVGAAPALAPLATAPPANPVVPVLSTLPPEWGGPSDFPVAKQQAEEPPLLEPVWDTTITLVEPETEVVPEVVPEVVNLGEVVENLMTASAGMETDPGPSPEPEEPPVKAEDPWGLSETTPVEPAPEEPPKPAIQGPLLDLSASKW